MTILAFLKLVPTKDWLYGGILAALLISFGWYTHHERTVGAAKIVHSDAVAVAVKEKANLKGETNAQADIAQAVDNFDLRVGAPVVGPAPRLVCQPARDSGPLSGRPPASGESDDAPASAGILSQSSGSTFDPAPAVLSDADEADRLAAELALAQDTIRAYQTQGVVQK